MFTTSMLRSLWIAILLMLPVTIQSQSSSYGNDYYDYGDGSSDQQQQDYSQDSLYHDYASRQQDKEVGTAASSPASWAFMAAAAGMGWVCGATFHGRRLKKKLNAKFKKDQKDLYQQYYNDVYALQQQNSELVAALEKQYAGTGSSRRK